MWRGGVGPWGMLQTTVLVKMQVVAIVVVVVVVVGIVASAAGLKE